MMCDPLTTPAGACSPAVDRAGPDASARLPEWVVHLLALVIRCMLERMLAACSRRSRLPSWWHERPDLPAGSVQALAASVRGEFGNVIAWMCRRRGIGPGHPDWPALSRAIVANGGSVQGFRAGLPACGLQWWENPNVMPGMVGETTAAPAATAMALLLSRQAVADAASPAATNIMRSEAEPTRLPAIRRRVFARTATGPPTGPPGICGDQPVTSDERGQPMAGPAVLIRADRKFPIAEAENTRLQSLTRQPARTLRLIPAL